MEPRTQEREDTLQIPDEMPEVLVVGAGPVGLYAALMLAEQGVRVQIVDQERRPAARSYALALHPQSLRLLGEAGLTDELLPMAHRVDTLAFYEGSGRQAVLDFSALEGDLPCVAVLPQQILEGALESRLLRRGVPVLWNHRVSELALGHGAMVAEVERLERAGGEHAAVEDRFEVRADFLLGTDGHHSLVRRSLEIPFEDFGPAELYAVFEFTADGPAEREARVIFHDGRPGVLWPLGGRRFRWSLQIEDWEGFEEPRFKSRHFPRVSDEPFPYLVRDRLHQLLAERAPWFRPEIGEILWSMAVRFERRLAGRFGQGRAWLAGDAAHLAGPIGIQSMNLGLVEARDLARRLASILREDYPLSLLDRYDATHHAEWRRLLGGQAAPGPDATPWVREHAASLLPCIPASGPDLAILLGQIGLAVR
ncbi:MAG TPA: FAD-dependent monooxygenase [Thermoanaerobaculia bacterium]|nr:FAD-dependent monooxygenase [Thermoanaerobaculia bacterium]